MSNVELGPSEVVAFWREAGPEKWFRKDAEFDRLMVERFTELHGQAAMGRKDSWAETPDGALALVLLLDQFSRNMFRGSPKAFAQDGQALRVAKKAIEAGFDTKVAPELRSFFYMPFMHAEAIEEQERCVSLLHSIAPDWVGYARDHERIIRRFGRFPHRNPVLGRPTTPAEKAFLDDGGFSG